MIALAARGVPSALRPVPEEDPALEGARALSALRAQCQKASTAWKNSLRSRLLDVELHFRLSRFGPLAAH